MNPNSILRLEGAGVAAVATVAYFTLGGPLWLFVLLAFAPDISMVAYLAGLRIGSSVYNAFHTYLAPITLGTTGVLLGVTPVSWLALVWAGHIGVDRAVGYGLKYSTGFKHTHLSDESERDTSVDITHIISDDAGLGDD